MDLIDWPEALPAGTDLGSLYHPVLLNCRNRGNEALTSLLFSMREGFLTIPDYQRDVVWTPKQRAKFAGYFLEGGPQAALFIREVGPTSTEGVYEELVDGQQRLLALAAFEEGKIPAILPSQGKCVWVKDIENFTWRMWGFPVGRFSGTRAEAMSLYIAINEGGTPHTSAELDRVRALIEKELAKGVMG